MSDSPLPSPSSSNVPPSDPVMPADIKDAQPCDVPERTPEAAPVSTPARTRGGIPTAGTELRGSVAVIAGDQVFLDVGLRRQAVIARTQFDNGTLPAVGAEVEVVVVEFDVRTELLHVSRKGTPVISAFTGMTVGAILEGKISGMNKGGLEVQFGTVRGFMPSSQVDTRALKDISVLLGQDARCEIVEIDEKNQKLIVSRRAVLKKEAAESRVNLLQNLEVGQVLKGVVTNFAEFGAFIDLGGVHGLVHISDMKWTPVEKPSDVVKIGDNVEVKVLKVNKDRKRISLGMKQMTPDPWSDLGDRFAVGTKLQVPVVKLADFGAFAEVADGIVGLIPLSELSWTHRLGGAGEMFTVGQVVDVVVIGVDTKRRRISLSIKQLTEDPWATVPETFAPDSIVTGKVSKLLDFGVLVELAPGIEGMIHISELSDRRVNSTQEVATVGDEVKVKVLGVDGKKRRISLSIRATLESAEAVAPTEAPVKRKRTKPLRGGLASHFDW